MNDDNHQFRCEHFVPNSDGSVRHYVLEVIDTESGESLDIFVTPRELASHALMKRVLLNKRVFYSSTKIKHDELLSSLFSVTPKPL